MSLHLVDGTEESFMTGHDGMTTHTLARLRVIESALAVLCMQSEDHKRLYKQFVTGILKIYADNKDNIPADEFAVSQLGHQHSYHAIFREDLPDLSPPESLPKS